MEAPGVPGVAVTAGGSTLGLYLYFNVTVGFSHRWWGLRIIDLTMTLRPGPPLYPGDPETRFRVVAGYEGEGFYLREVCHSEHAGTHIDAPAHFYPGGVGVDSIPLWRLVAPGVVVDARGVNAVTSSLLDGLGDGVTGKAVVVVTGYSGRGRWPLVDEGFARRLVDEGAALLAIDAPSPDIEPYPVHRILLGAGIPIVENLCCPEQLLGAGEFLLVVAPVPYEGGSGAPARVFAVLGWGREGLVEGQRGLDLEWEKAGGKPRGAD